ncbi:MAG TPA: non-homologous end-joining DNA ligase [Actinomycetota bacterium]|nr:non-homologous end-joining DNA ligase [Actinomycetota bacterium]
MTSGIVVEAAGHAVPVTNPEKPFFPALGITKLDVVRYFVEVGEAALAGCRDRPSLLKRHPGGVTGEFFYQKRVPPKRPEWIETVTVSFPSGRTAEFLVVHDTAHLAYMANLGCLEIHPWPVRCDDVDHPDELRIDLDPTPEATFAQVREVAMVARNTLADFGLAGFAKTSGKRGIHVNVRIERQWSFTEVRRAALAFAREVERRVPAIATTAWWKEQRHGVFIDYNQNARDRTVASAYSIRPVDDARVSCPLTWDEVAEVDPAAFTIRTVPERLRTSGDPGAAIDAEAHSLETLLELAARDEHEGLGDAPWPPHFPKADREPARVAPSRARKPPTRAKTAPKDG